MAQIRFKVLNIQTMQYIDIAYKTLQKGQIPLTAEEIWIKSAEWKTRGDFVSTGKTPALTIGSQIYMEIAKQGEQSRFCKYSKYPTKFYLTGEIPKEPAIEAVVVPTKEKWHEIDLHPLLVSFVRVNQHFSAFTKTIVAQTSKHGKAPKTNLWLHPDMVGVHFPFEDYGKDVLDLQKATSSSSVRFFSFELKRELNYANLRASFFQAVSNSSWAHEGYLVTLNLLDDDDFREDLRQLNSAFGIGIIQLNAEHVEDSTVVYPSHKKDDTIEWDFVNRLTANNVDFKNFVQHVNANANMQKMEHVNVQAFDKVFSDEEMEKYVSVKGFVKKNN